MSEFTKMWDKLNSSVLDKTLGDPWDAVRAKPSSKPINIVYSGITKQVLDKREAEYIGEVTYSWWPLTTGDKKWTLRQAPLPGVDRGQLWLSDEHVPAKVKLALALLQ